MPLRGAALGEMTPEDKIEAMMSAFGYSREEAINFLIDCGEIEEGEGADWEDG